MKRISDEAQPRFKVPARSDMRNRQEGKIGWVFLWLIGIPIPLLVILFLVRGCT